MPIKMVSSALLLAYMMLAYVPCMKLTSLNSVPYQQIAWTKRDQASHKNIQV